mmetsp:Transcript_36291/g.91415  ORF Transcript_36291/g.91415 Transcript_36291/m.91415 type:complete len:320 (-) Transcript_36291:160-1119(-)
MAFPAGALLHRLREHYETPWAAHMPAHFHESLASNENIFGSTPGRAESAAGCLSPLRLLGALPCDGKMAGKVWRLSRDAQGCREVQRALGQASEEEHAEVVDELRGHFWDAIRCPHANHVIQKCVVVMAPSLLQVLIDEVMDGKLIQAARHKYGCRVIQRLLEHCPVEQIHELVELLLAEFLEVSRHAYGIFVVQKLLQHTVEEQRDRLADLVEQHATALALHPHGCAVLGVALEHGSLAERRRLAEMLLEDRSHLAFMASTRHGTAIVTSLLETLDDSGRKRLSALSKGHPKLEEILGHSSEADDSEIACKFEATSKR